MYGFVAALRAQTSDRLQGAAESDRPPYFSTTRNSCREKRFRPSSTHALNALLDAGREVIVAADRPPNDLQIARRARALAPERSAFASRSARFDEPLRLKILEARVAAGRAAETRYSKVTPSVLAFVARSIRSNGRDLEGAVNRLRARCTRPGPPLTVETAEVAIRDLIRTHEPKRVKIEDIQKLVASHYSVSRADILSSRRTAAVVKPRQVAMFLAKVLTPRSLPEIGRRFLGGRDQHADRSPTRCEGSRLWCGAEQPRPCGDAA